MKKINIFTLGCSKNRVDTEVLIKQLEQNNFIVEHESPENDFDTIIINTCGFIGDAKEESIETILNFVSAKQDGDISKLLVFGCLSERYKDELKNEIPEVDGWFGKFDLQDMLDFMGANRFDNLNPLRTLTTPPHYAFLKISEGCDRTCSFCAIPIITKGHKSRPMDELVEEAKQLVKQGVKEVILIAQELSYYGIDLYKKQMLAPLMEELAQIKGIVWLRIHYTYPASFPTDVLDVMAKYDNICAYMDIALQHISDNVLGMMKRNIDKAGTYKLIETFRDKVPGITLRTTLLVGHPDETQEDFNELKQFVKDVEFERLGVFPYSHEENTYAYINYEDNISQDVKEQRVEEIMELQQAISLKHNNAKIGKTLKVLIDSKEGDYFIGRTEFDSPEVDGEVMVESTKPLIIGNFYDVEITDASDYDLVGSIA